MSQLEIGQKNGMPLAFHYLCPYENIPATPTLKIELAQYTKNNQFPTGETGKLTVGVGKAYGMPCLGISKCAIYPCSGLVDFAEFIERDGLYDDLKKIYDRRNGKKKKV